MQFFEKLLTFIRTGIFDTKENAQSMMNHVDRINEEYAHASIVVYLKNGKQFHNPIKCYGNAEIYGGKVCVFQSAEERLISLFHEKSVRYSTEGYRRGGSFYPGHEIKEMYLTKIEYGSD